MTQFSPRLFLELHLILKVRDVVVSGNILDDY